ncbi:MAG: Crp/Fnr family transcriptional regulator [Flavobacteriales bacterium]|jgi:CRP-like cAMP-binding protein|nr:Crp/Fnr family transcriptional regulator [Flavobacteriales bacterium]
MKECNHDCTTCVFKEQSLLNELSHDELSILESHRNSVEYQSGEVIYKEGMKATELLCVNSGMVKILKKTGKGEDRAMDVKKPIEFIGFQALMSNEAHQDTAIAMVDTGICSIDKADLMRVIENNSGFALKVIEDQAKELNYSTQRLLALTDKNMKSRMCDTLLRLLDDFGVDETGALTVNLKRREIAGLSNMTTSNAIRTLSEIAKDGLIELVGKKIIITDRPGVEQVSTSG